MMEKIDAGSIEVLFEDEDYLIVNKPHDLLINSDDENNQNTLHRMLVAKKDLKSEICEPGIRHLKHGYHFIHRLDYATSGVICLGKTSRAASVAGRLFEKRLVDKYYLAILTGHLSEPMIEVDIAIGYDNRHLEDNKMMVTDGPFSVKPKPAVTRILLLETGQYAGRKVSKVLMKPMTGHSLASGPRIPVYRLQGATIVLLGSNNTYLAGLSYTRPAADYNNLRVRLKGRRHQLRVHCHHIGHTILGDFTYSNRSDTEPPRMFLHSHRLHLPLKTGPINISTSDPFAAENLSGLIETGIVYNSLDNTNACDILNGANNAKFIKFVNKDT